MHRLIRRAGQYYSLRKLKTCLYSCSPASQIYSCHFTTTTTLHERPKAVIFDIGGVVIPSPFPLISQFESKYRLPNGSVNKTIRHYGEGGVFSRLERGEITLEQFCVPFANEFSKLHQIPITGKQVWDLAAVLGGVGVTLSPYKEVTDLMRKLKESGIKIAIITNNFKFDNGKTVLPTGNLDNVDVIIQSCVEGLKKPDPNIYNRALKKLGVTGEQAVFLDDIGTNLKAAKQLGMITIKVDDIPTAVRQVEQLVLREIPIPSGTTEVSTKLLIPIDRLVGYLKETHGLSQEEPPLVRTFKLGQSNPTYYVEYGGVQMVLRKKPPGKLLPSAHAVEREYKVMKAVGDHGVPIPELLSLCEDDSVVGTPFYVMKYVPGRVLQDPSLPSMNPNERKEIYNDMCRVLATIHAVNIEKAGLETFGKHGNYVSRQIDRWSKQYRSSMTHDIPAMDKLLDWLSSHVPNADTTTVVHGDFRLDNLIFAPDKNEVVAVLDWELSTLGDPFSDLAYSCLPYYLQPDFPALKGLCGRDLSTLGIPTEEEFLSRYCSLRGISHVPNWTFYMAFSFFRLAAIVQGVYKRALQNQASADNAKSVGLLAEEFAKKGWSLAQHQTNSNSSGTSVNPRSTRSYSTATFSSDLYTTSLLLSDFSSFPPLLKDLREQLLHFMKEDIFPSESTLQDHQLSDKRWEPHPLIETLKDKARSQGLWNLFLPVETDMDRQYGRGLTNLEYSHLAEIMGQSVFASEVFNCSAPDTGNMEVLVRYGTNEQKTRWLTPLLKGDIRSCFAMTEPAVASSDATNIQSSIVAEGDHYVLNGHKWWISGAIDPRCQVCIFMGKNDFTASKYKQQSMILVPMDTPGVHVVRPLTVFGYDDAPSGHAEMRFDNVKVPKENILLGEGRGFEIAQGRLGPGRIHHCMRLIGMAERALQLMTKRVKERSAFGKTLAEFDTILASIAQSRIEIEEARLLTLKAAHKMDTVGNKLSRNDIGIIKVVAPLMAQRVVDRAMQAHGALGLSGDQPLAQFYGWARILRLADGPDEVHRAAIGKTELKRS